jgi:hypothetical protein
MFNHKNIALNASMLVAGLFFNQSPAMAFGLGNLVPGAQSSAAGDPDSFLKSAAFAEGLMKNSVGLMARSLASKEKAAEFAAAQKAANTITDPAEKQAKLADIDKAEMASLNEALSNEKFKADIQKMDSSRKVDLGASAYNFALALLQDKALIEQSKGLIAGLASNPMNLSKVGSLKEAASSLSNQFSSASSIAGKMPEVFSAVGIQAPTSKDDKPKAVAQVQGD